MRTNEGTWAADNVRLQRGGTLKEQQYLLAQQDLRDAADATNAGDRAGVVNALTRAISRGPDALRPRRRLRG